MSRPERRPPLLVLGFVFLASGAAALLFETLWFRQAGLAFGNTVWASALVLAGFMTGLALGNALAARYGERWRRPIRLYALLELTIAGTGVALVLLLPFLPPLLAPLQRSLAGAPALLQLVRFVLTLVLLAVPSLAMGVTLPLLVEALARGRGDFGRALAFLYGANTLGAVAGALAGEAFLIERLGVIGTALGAAALNGAAALGALALAARHGEGAARPAPAAEAGPALGTRSRRGGLAGAGPFLLAAFLAGGTLLALEVVWFRLLVLFVAGTSLAFAVMLAVVLAGIGAGSLFASLLLARWPGVYRGAAAVAFATGAAAIGAYLGFDRVLPGGGVPILTRPQDVLRNAAALMLPAALLSGVLFPLVGKAIHERVGSAVRATGLLTLANTAGAALGPLAAGFLLLPAAGMERSLFVLTALYGVAAACLLAGEGFSVLRRPVVVAAGLAFAAALIGFPWGEMDQRLLAAVEARYAGGGEHVVAVREGLTETIHYTQQDRFGEPFDHRLVTNGYSMSGTALLGRRYMDLFVQLPVALHPGLRSALLISYGVGTTARALTRTAELETIDVVDVSRDVLEMNRIVFPDEREYPLADPRVAVHVEDGRHFLQTTSRRFDLITAEPPPPKYAGIVYLATEEFFRLVHERLAEGGIFTYWLPVNQLSPGDAKTITAAFCNAFEDCSLWAGSAFDWILLGTSRLHGPLSVERVSAQWGDPEVRAELERIAIEEPAQLSSDIRI